MTRIATYLAKKVMDVLLLALLLVGLLWLVRPYLPGLPDWFGGQTQVEHAYVIRRFERESQLVVAGADVTDTMTKSFNNSLLSTWPNWTQPLTSLFISRELVVEIPVKTEFKLDLKDLTEDDIHLEGQTLSFKAPLTVYVDSQQEGEIRIQHASNGLVDKAVDAFTAGQKAQEFLSEKSQEALYEASETLMSQPAHQEKVARFAKASLENLLNLGSEEAIEVDLSLADLRFVTVDQP